jgi:hypothetical protein
MVMEQLKDIRRKMHDQNGIEFVMVWRINGCVNHWPGVVGGCAALAKPAFAVMLAA